MWGVRPATFMADRWGGELENDYGNRMGPRAGPCGAVDPHPDVVSVGRLQIFEDDPAAALIVATRIIPTLLRSRLSLAEVDHIWPPVPDMGSLDDDDS